MESAVNSMFAVVFPGKSNYEVFNDALEIYMLREQVLAKLLQIEMSDTGDFWWQDKELMGIFDLLYKSGVILLPTNPAERLRWIALLCVEISNYEEFDCGNVILPIDFLPDEMLELFEDAYGAKLIEEVIKTRKQLVEQGWESLGV